MKEIVLSLEELSDLRDFLFVAGMHLEKQRNAPIQRLKKLSALLDKFPFIAGSHSDKKEITISL